MTRIILLTAWLLLVPVGWSRAQPADDPNEPPVAGQPEDFTGAVGVYQVRTSAQPTELQAEDALTFTVRITGHGPANHPPTRPNLHRRPAFTKRFVVEDLDEKADPTAGVWEFRYRLKPRSPEVTEIPALRFSYFKPGIIPREKGFRSAYADSIPLTVKPRTEVQASDVKGDEAPSRFPEAVYQLAEGPATVLRREEPFALPVPLALLFALLLAPPLLCGGWYLVWRRLYPDAARQLRQRRSRAAQIALRSLEQADRDDPDREVQRVAAVTTEYLRGRWELTAGEPTPAEVAGHLRQVGCPAELAEQTAAFFRACDVARFAPGGGPDREALRATAVEIILALEGQPWPAPVS